ncbi:polysaccharide biosynthesis protein [Nonomuraea sp. NPDC046570]|uniref:polysaccharide biosynthesis protein n=1 Tax=Nonomuraea sp. NPDC046570 TaxID=3155255 RepID=UPI0033D2D5D9
MLARLRSRRRQRGTPVLLVGALGDGPALARWLLDAPGRGVRPVGFLDDELTGQVHGLPVLGTIAQLGEVAAATGVEVVVAVPGQTVTELARLIEAAAGVGLAFGHANEAPVVATRLLGRAPAGFDRTRIRRAVKGQRVLVTGVNDIVGKELCGRLEELNAASVTMLCTAERTLDEVFAELRPEIVFHADLVRDLSLAERQPCVAVSRNVLGTRQVLDAALRHGAERFVVVSGVEAADPSSVLGATYRLAELVVQAAAGGGVRLAATRLGVLIATARSPLAALGEQACRAEAMTVGHPDTARYFMTLQEAAELTLEVAALAERGEVFALDIGAPVPVVTLVHAFAEQLRLPEVRIRFTGLQPGERQFDKLFSGGEARVPTANPQVWAARPGPAPAGQASLLNRLDHAATRGSDHDVRTLLRRLLPEYRPAGTREPARLTQEAL